MQPLAEVLRPFSLEDFIDQDHLVGDLGPIKKAIENDSLYSMIFWGPPGCGKTTLARIISQELNADFIEISPTTAGVKDIREAVARAESRFFGEKLATILFVDEIHRFNKAQQDYLLPHVEKGTITLVGATTENPSFSVISPLLSRARVYKFKPISPESIEKLIKKALKHLKSQDNEIKVTKGGIEFLVQLSNGDARNALNAIETLTVSGQKRFTPKEISQILQEKPLRYDKKGDAHYDTISAFIKSMRASNPSAAVYYLARMVEAGEDPKFIARRMIVFASEDVGLANPTALVVANEVYRAVETIGYPECRINLAQGAIYLATCKKDRRVYDAMGKAQKDVQKYGNLSIPLHIRNAPTDLMKEMGYGEGYEMYPDEKSKKSFLPDKLKNKKYFKS